MQTIFNAAAPLERYGHNLTRLAKAGTFSPLLDHEAIINRAFHILQRKDKNNPVILGADESTRWAIVAEVTRRMAIGNAPEPLPTRQIIRLDYEALFADLVDDTLLRHERWRRKIAPRLRELEEQLADVEPESDEALTLLWELFFRHPDLEEWIAPTMALERLQAMFIEMRRAEGTFILYVDHFHRLLGGEPEQYPMDAVDLLKPTLARGQVQLIGTCTVEQYRRYVERDAAIQRRCQEICLPIS